MSVAGLNTQFDYSQAGSIKAIEYIFSRRLLKRLYAATCMTEITTNDADPASFANLKNQGDTIVFQKDVDVDILPYVRGMETPMQMLSNDSISFKVQRAHMWFVGMDILDIKQIATDKLANAEEVGGRKGAIAIEREFWANTYNDADSGNKGANAGTSHVNIGTMTNPVVVTEKNLLQLLLLINQVGDEANWDPAGRWVVLPSFCKPLFLGGPLSSALFSGDSKSTIRSGDIGDLLKLNFYISNLLPKFAMGGTVGDVSPICFGHTSSTASIIQMQETTYFDKLERTGGKGMRCITLYDWKTLLPERRGLALVSNGGFSIQL
jgi:hypothetical protein